MIKSPVKHTHALLTSEKPSIRYGPMDFFISYYNIMSEENILAS